MSIEALSYFKSFPHELADDIILYARLGLQAIDLLGIPKIESYLRCPYCGAEYDLPRSTSRNASPRDRGPGGWHYYMYECGASMAFTVSFDGVVSVFAVSMPTDGCAMVYSLTSEDDMV